MTGDPARRVPRRPVVRPAAVALAVGLIAASAVPAGAATWYVRKSGNDSNSGTSAGQAFRTLRRAAEMDTVSDVVYVGAGTYTESVTGLEDGADGALAYWIADLDGTRTGDAGAVTWRPANGGTYALRLGDEHHIVFYGFRFAANPDAAGADGVFAPDASDLFFSTCRFEGLSVGLRVTDGGAACFDCVFDDCGTGVRADRATVFQTRDTFTDCDSSIYSADAGVVTAADSAFTAAAGAGNHLNLPGGSTLTLRRCTVTGGLNGVYQPDGPSATIEDCTFSGAGSVALWLVADDTTVEGCDVSSLDTAVYLPTGGDPAPLFRDTTIRDSDTGIYTQQENLALRNVTMSGHDGEAIHVAPANPSFRLGAEDTVTVTNNAVGLRWDGNGSVNALTVEGQTWSDNTVHVYAAGVETVAVTDSTFAGGAIGVRSAGGNAVTLRRVNTDGCGAVEDWNGGRLGAQLFHAAVTVEDCNFEHGYYGLQLIDVAPEPDLRNVLCGANSENGLDLNGLTWTWNAADAVTLTGNRVGLVANGCTITIDGGAPGIDVAGNTAAGYSHALYFDGGTIRATNVRAADSNVGFDFRNVADAELNDCTATGCPNWGAYVQRGSSTADVVAALRNFTASDCGGGVSYARGTAGGVGQIVLEQVACARPVTVDADGYPGAASGTGVYLHGCPLDPAYQNGLFVEGFHHGVYVRDAPATLTAAMNVHPSRCRNGVIVVAGALTATGYVSAATRYALYLVPNDNPILLTDCDLTASDRAVYVRNGGDLTAAGCTFAARDDDCVLYSTEGAPNVTLTNCTAAAAGGDGFRFSAGAGGALSFTDCRVIDAGSDGFEVAAAAGGAGTARFSRCAVDRARDQGFEVSNLPTAFRGCAVTNAAGGYFLGDCPVSEMTACRVADCSGGGVLLSGTTALEAANLLAVRCYVGIETEADGPVVLDHATLAVTRDALKVGAGEVTVRNSVLVAGDDGCDRDGGSVAFDHVLVHAPTPYEGATGGPDDFLADPRFRDPAAGDYRLAEGSPAINAGADLSGVVDGDLDGLPRPSHRRHDLGAYEYQEAEGSLRILDWRERAE